MGGRRIAVLGLGEAGSLIAGDLAAAGADVRGFDPLLPPPPGVQARTGDADAVRDADLVLSLNSAHDALSALRAALPALRPGTLWADLNTAAPALKHHLADVAAARGVAVVDVALMAPVPGRGLATPMVASGEAAEVFADLLAGFGVTVELVPGPVGTAISRKLLRSVFYKGLAAAVLEALAGARAAGCEEWLRENISDELAGFDDNALERLVDGSRRHARRRIDEMDAAAQQLTDLNVPPHVATAARDVLQTLVQPTS